MVTTQSTRPPVMKDVAKIAQVSHQTVSRVLNGHPSVSPEARARVEAAIVKLGYRRNFIARSLVTRQSQTIGVLASDLAQYGPARTLLGIESAARDAGYFVSIATLREISMEAVTDVLNHFFAQNVDGIVVAVPHPGVLEALDRIGPSLPVIAASSARDRPGPGAAVDQRAGARLAVNHLINLGHDKIGHLSGPMDWFDAAERVEGWREAINEAGLVPGPLLDGDWSARAGHEAGMALDVGGAESATAMFVSNDQMALGLLLALHQRQVKVPEDISIVGYDDQPESPFFYPPLTTVRQDFEAVGRHCIAAMLEHLQRNQVLREFVSPELIIRATTAPPAVQAQRCPV